MFQIGAPFHFYLPFVIETEKPEYNNYFARYILNFDGLRKKTSQLPTSEPICFEEKSNDNPPLIFVLSPEEQSY